MRVVRCFPARTGRQAITRRLSDQRLGVVEVGCQRDMSVAMRIKRGVCMCVSYGLGRVSKALRWRARSSSMVSEGDGWSLRLVVACR